MCIEYIMEPPSVDYYAMMKFKMGSWVLYNEKACCITGWSTNGDKGLESTFCYQLNGSGELVQETELTATEAPAAPAAEAAPAEAAAEAAPAAEPAAAEPAAAEPAA